MCDRWLVRQPVRLPSSARGFPIDRSHTTGRVSLDRTARGRAINIPHRSAFCIATRLGASSPNTSVNIGQHESHNNDRRRTAGATEER